MNKLTLKYSSVTTVYDIYCIEYMKFPKKSKILKQNFKTKMVTMSDDEYFN